MMTKKKVLAIILALSCACVLRAEQAAGTDAAADTLNAAADEGQVAIKGGKFFMQVGALESRESQGGEDKCMLRKKSSRLEFYSNNDTKIFLRLQGSPDSVKEGSYLVINGPKNAKTVIAKTVYVYGNRQEYDDSLYAEAEKDEKQDEGRFVMFVKGRVKKIQDSCGLADYKVMVVGTDEGRDMLLSFDDATYWVVNKTAKASDMAAGDRLKLYFNQRTSIRVKNYPVKIVIDRAKAGY